MWPYQIGLELIEVNVEGAVEAKRGDDGGDDLSNQTVQVVVGGTLHAKVVAADVVDRLHITVIFC